MAKPARFRGNSPAKYLIFKSEETNLNADSFGLYGIASSSNSLLYDAMFTKKVASRIAELLNSSTSPEDWNATRTILEREGLLEPQSE